MAMNIIGHGIDTVDAVRFEKMYQSGKAKYFSRYFTENELNSVGIDSERIPRLATRVAAKEAIMKALRHGFGDGLGFTDIEILTGENGEPIPKLHGKAALMAERLGVQAWWLSFSHSGGVAVASAIACG